MPSDASIVVVRSIPPSYPEFMDKLLHPELSGTGPAEYDFSAVRSWFFPGQEHEGVWIEGNEIYNALESVGMLVNCFGLRDLEEIREKGTCPIFRWEYLRGKTFFAWKDAAMFKDGQRRVPYLSGCSGGVLMGWFNMDEGFNRNMPAHHFEEA